MKWRIPEYMARLASTHRLDVWSAVLYVGRGAGLDDTGTISSPGLMVQLRCRGTTRLCVCGRCRPRNS